MTSLRPDVEAANWTKMRVNLYEEASAGLPLREGLEKTRFVKKGTITARTVGGSYHYDKDLDSLIRIVCKDLSSAQKFSVKVTAEKNDEGVKFIFKS